METQEILTMSVLYLFVGSVLLGLLHEDYDIPGLISFVILWPLILITTVAGFVRSIVMSIF